MRGTRNKIKLNTEEANLVVRNELEVYSRRNSKYSFKAEIWFYLDYECYSIHETFQSLLEIIKKKRKERNYQNEYVWMYFLITYFVTDYIYIYEENEETPALERCLSNTHEKSPRYWY